MRFHLREAAEQSYLHPDLAHHCSTSPRLAASEQQNYVCQGRCSRNTFLVPKGHFHCLQEGLREFSEVFSPNNVAAKTLHFRVTIHFSEDTQCPLRGLAGELPRVVEQTTNCQRDVRPTLQEPTGKHIDSSLNPHRALFILNSSEMSHPRRSSAHCSPVASSSSSASCFCPVDAPVPFCQRSSMPFSSLPSPPPSSFALSLFFPSSAPPSLFLFLPSRSLNPPLLLSFLERFCEATYCAGNHSHSLPTSDVEERGCGIGTPAVFLKYHSVVPPAHTAPDYVARAAEDVASCFCLQARANAASPPVQAVWAPPRSERWRSRWDSPRLRFPIHGCRHSRCSGASCRGCAA